MLVICGAFEIVKIAPTTGVPISVALNLVSHRMRADENDVRSQAIETSYIIRRGFAGPVVDKMAFDRLTSGLCVKLGLVIFVNAPFD